MSEKLSKSSNIIVMQKRRQRRPTFESWILQQTDRCDSVGDAARSFIDFKAAFSEWQRTQEPARAVGKLIAWPSDRRKAA